MVTEMNTPMSALARAYDEYLRVGQDPGGADQSGDGQQDVEARRVDGVRPDPGLDHVPDRGHVPLHHAELRRPV
ncbi:MAG TPA: hypothetical protein VGJ50_26415, partial [Streptosporangiaceae bacterium]